MTAVKDILVNAPARQLFGLRNKGNRCWFNAALQAWCHAKKFLKDQGVEFSKLVTRYDEALCAATCGSGLDRADTFFEEFTNKLFVVSPDEAYDQQDARVAFCGITGYADNPVLNNLFQGSTTSTIKCFRCNVHFKGTFKESSYNCDNANVETIKRRLANSIEEYTDNIHIDGCTCSIKNSIFIEEIHVLPRILTITTNEPTDSTNNFPEHFAASSRHNYTLIATICKSGPPSGGHYWTNVLTPNGWQRCDDSTVTPSPHVHCAVAGIYAQTSV